MEFDRADRDREHQGDLLGGTTLCQKLQNLPLAVPSFGIKIDTVPGRINGTWFKATREGVCYGQCSELCGKDHAFMPIAVRIVSEQAFAAWVEDAKKNTREMKTCRRRTSRRCRRRSDDAARGAGRKPEITRRT